MQKLKKISYAILVHQCFLSKDKSVYNIYILLGEFYCPFTNKSSMTETCEEKQTIISTNYLYYLLRSCKENRRHNSYLL